jgi:hypothetical protein
MMQIATEIIYFMYLLYNIVESGFGFSRGIRFGKLDSLWWIHQTVWSWNSRVQSKSIGVHLLDTTASLAKNSTARHWSVRMTADSCGPRQCRHQLADIHKTLYEHYALGYVPNLVLMCVITCHEQYQ